MSSAQVLSGSNSLLALYGVGLGLNPSKSFSSLPHESASRTACTSKKAPAAEDDIGEAGDSNFLCSLNLPGPVKAAFELVGLFDILAGVTSLPGIKGDKSFVSSNKARELESTSVKRLLVLILCSLGCASISFISGLFVILRAMFASRIYTIATRFGLAPSLQQRGALYDASSSTVLQERLKVANLAVRQLKTESLSLQEKLKAAGDRISKLEGNQADYATFNELQTKYNRVSAEIARLTKENAELKTNVFCVTKENLELRQCLAIKEADDACRLGALARLQNQRLDSCIFPKDDETLRKKADDEDVNEASEESVVIVTDLECLKSIPRDASGTSAPALILSPSPSMVMDHPSPAHASISVANAGLIPPASATSNCDLRIVTPESETVSSIPVFTSPRPSLPPKASKPRLKPLLLAARFAVSGSARRLGAKHASMRKLGAQLVANSKIGVANGEEKESKACISTDSHMLNPCAPAFTPRTSGDASSKVTITSDTKSLKPSAALSPALSPFIFDSPSPNSPFLRPAPLRRQSGDALLLPASPVPPIGTPRSTRASSVRLIRARVAQRNLQRVASGCAVVPSGSLTGMKTMVDGKTAHAKARLVGKGMPPRPALGELTNAESRVDAAAGRWVSM